MYSKISALARRLDEDATRELVTILEHADPAVRLEAARALAMRWIPTDLHERVSALLFDGRADVSESLARWPLRVAMKAFLAQPKAFDRAAPLLTGDLRTEILLSTVEDMLVAVSTGDGTPDFPDERFWPVARQFLDHPRLGHIATLAHDGFRYFENEDVYPNVLRVELGEYGDPMLPILVAGFVVNEVPANAPYGLALYSHQYGGLSCLHTEVLGYALALTAEETAQVDRLAREWSETHGDPLDAAQLARVSAIFGVTFDAGHEAFVTARSAPAPLGRLVLRATAEASWRRVTEPRDGYIYGETLYTEDEVRTLASLGLGAPMLTLLWGNSD